MEKYEQNENINSIACSIVSCYNRNFGFQKYLYENLEMMMCQLYDRSDYGFHV